MIEEYSESGELVIPGAWREQECIEHGYKGVPPCPHLKCANGTERDLWIGLHVEIASSDDVRVTEERVFVKDRRGRREWGWREMIDKPAA